MFKDSKSSAHWHFDEVINIKKYWNICLCKSVLKVYVLGECTSMPSLNYEDNYSVFNLLELRWTLK